MLAVGREPARALRLMMQSTVGSQRLPLETT